MRPSQRSCRLACLLAVAAPPQLYVAVKKTVHMFTTRFLLSVVCVLLLPIGLRLKLKLLLEAEL